MEKKKPKTSPQFKKRSFIVKPIRDFRIEYDVSNQDLADALGLTLSAVSSWFRKSEIYGNTPKIEHLISLAKWSRDNFVKEEPPYLPINFTRLFFESGKTPWEEMLLRENQRLRRENAELKDVIGKNV